MSPTQDKPPHRLTWVNPQACPGHLRRLEWDLNERGRDSHDATTGPHIGYLVHSTGEGAMFEVNELPSMWVNYVALF